MKKMIKTSLFAIATGLVAVGASYAGPMGAPMKSMPMKMEIMPPPQPELCFEANEFSLDLFYATPTKNGNWMAGGGVGVNYFATEWVGVGVDGYWYHEDDHDTTIHNVTGSLIFRAPIQDWCLAPYAYVGGGVHTNGDTDGSVHVGGGLEWRVFESFGIFADGRYTWVEREGFDDDDGYALVKGGLRFAF